MTRPLAIQKDGTWFTYGYDITKNICEVFGPAGYIRTAYSYAPFGNVTESGDVSQPFQWSSEHYDSELDLVYYNYRHYSPSLGRFLSRDPIAEQGGLNLYAFVKNNTTRNYDVLGRELLVYGELQYRPKNQTVFGVSDTDGKVIFDGWRIYPGKLMRDKKTCCYYLENPLIEIKVFGSYNDEESRRHEQYHFDVWVNSFVAFELVAKALLFKDKNCIGSYLNILGTWYMLRGLLENSRFDMIAHKNDPEGREYARLYYETQREIQNQKELLDLKSKGCLC